MHFREQQLISNCTGERDFSSSYQEHLHSQSQSDVCAIPEISSEKFQGIKFRLSLFQILH